MDTEGGRNVEGCPSLRPWVLRRYLPEQGVATRSSSTESPNTVATAHNVPET
jgi:hypothetical protein